MAFAAGTTIDTYEVVAPVGAVASPALEPRPVDASSYGDVTP